MNHWNCEACRSYNDILTNYCETCQNHKPAYITNEYQARVEIRRGIFLGYGILNISYRSERSEKMTPQEELFSKLYNHEKVLVVDMDSLTLRSHIQELSDIAFQAKARLIAASDEERERAAKSGKKEWLVSANTDVLVSDAINTVKARSARMSKMDKLKKQLLSAGIDEATVKEMVANLENKATDNKLKTVTFNKPATEITAVQVKVNKPETPAEPFDVSKLNFG